MARQFESQSKGWHNYPGHIGRLKAIERFPSYQSDKIKTTPDEDECIYYPLVYGQEEKLKIIVNPQDYGQYKKSQSNSQSPFMKSSMKENKNKSYGTDDDGCYEILRGSTVVQLSPPSRHHLGSRVGQDLTAPVSRSVLRALSNDFEPNKHRVLTLEPSKVCRQHELNVNNNYEHPKKANNSGHFVSPHADDGLYRRGNSEQLYVYVLCQRGFLSFHKRLWKWRTHCWPTLLMCWPVKSMCTQMGLPCDLFAVLSLPLVLLTSERMHERYGSNTDIAINLLRPCQRCRVFASSIFSPVLSYQSPVLRYGQRPIMAHGVYFLPAFEHPKMFL